MPDDEFSDEHTIVGDRRNITLPNKQKRDQAYVIVIAGPNVGEMFKIEKGVFIGRGTDAEIRLNDSEISRKHCRLVRTATSVVLEDLGSTNGTFVNGSPVDLQELKDGDKIQVGTTTILKFSYHDDLEEQFQRQMYESALRDALTGAYNKKYFQDHLTSEVAYALRHEIPLCLIILDLDHFKNINDTFGHLAGDYVLATFADLVNGSIRKEDIFARYGGEEFALISRGLSEEAGFRFAERIRRGVEMHEFKHEGAPVRVTISVGVASLLEAQVGSPNELVAAADKALYAAKHGGRNRSELYSASKHAASTESVLGPDEDASLDASAPEPTGSHPPAADGDTPDPDAGSARAHRAGDDKA